MRSAAIGRQAAGESPFHALVEAKLRFHCEITSGRLRHVGAALRRERITILPGFVEHIAGVREFFARYYGSAGPRVALVGINPGRFGGGKTGLPFLDPPAVSALLGRDLPGGGERSARFLWEVIAAEEPERFFDAVFITNLSWFGFARDGRNLNMDSLPAAAQSAIETNFIREMEFVRPRAVMPLGGWVERRLRRMREVGALNVPILTTLPHPRYVAFPSRRAAALILYRQALAPFLKPALTSLHPGGLR